MLRAEGLVKVYDGKRVVDGVNIQLGCEEIVGLLGDNGAGEGSCGSSRFRAFRPSLAAIGSIWQLVQSGFLHCKA